MGIVIIPLFLVAIYFLVDLYLHRQPLNESEVIRLARKRNRIKVIEGYSFSKSSIIANPSEKSAMFSGGELVKYNKEYFTMPATIAGLLKYKKHEWIVLAFIKDKMVSQVWWNKGPSAYSVSLLLSDDQIQRLVDDTKPDEIAILHNHPNPNPSSNPLNFLPSDTDIRSAELYGKIFATSGVRLLEFVCERGSSYLYYTSYVEKESEIQAIISEIKVNNDTSFFANYSLRKEIKRQTVAERVGSHQDCYSCKGDQIQPTA
jgi:hypothetical protein